MGLRQGTTARRALRALFWGIGWALVMPAAHAQNDQARSVRYDAQGRRDPFVPLVREGRIAGARVPGGGASNPALRGILWDPKGHSIALIEDVEARVGDRIGEFRVIEIRREAVVLAPEEGEPFVVELPFESLEPAGTKSTSQPGRRDRP